jgi:nucleoside-diphosphate-sugar epimerase
MTNLGTTQPKLIPASSGPVFVTGGSGFIGRHVVQVLDKHGYQVRALVRRVPQQGFNPTVDVVIGDLGEPETYTAALNSVSAVVHTALTDNLSDEPQATSLLQHMSAQAGVRKFIHLSSIAVYGDPPDGAITEETPPLDASDAYPRTKLAIESALQAGSSLSETVILRLGCVYGPGGGWWSEGLLGQMGRGKLIAVNDGAGMANLVHVFDVAAVVLTLLRRSNSHFDIFNITDGMPVTWRRYFSELETILGRPATVSMTAAEAREYSKKWLQPSLLHRLNRKLMGSRHIHPLDDRGISAFASRAVYSNQKAVSALAFRPDYSLETGVQTVRPRARGDRLSPLRTNLTGA